MNGNGYQSRMPVRLNKKWHIAACRGYLILSVAKAAMIAVPVVPKFE